MRTPRFSLVIGSLVAILAGAGISIAGCGSDNTEVGPGPGPGDLDGGGTDGTTTNPNTQGDARACTPSGNTCAADTDCCSSKCDPDKKVCLVGPSACSTPGTACTVSTECCTFSCVGGKCSDKQCTADNAACTANEECCGGKCDGGKCTPLSTTCKSTGNPCGGNGECCAKFCKNGFCGSPSFCAQNGDACSSDQECCGGSCDKAAGAALGTCSTVSTGGSSCAPAGSVCTGSGCDNFCCSLSCAPAAGGVSVCQPPSGCKPQNELCAADKDCCGGPGNPTGRVNGAGGEANPPKTCTVPQGETFGRCDFLQCLRPGDVCKTTAFACGGTSNDCCEGDLPDGGAPPPSFCNSNPDACCSQDALGIPRCRAVNFVCTPGQTVPAGSKCATSADCCGKPCVNNVCEGACVPTGGACTINADCCSGLPCNVPTGSTSGTCGVPNPPPPDGGTACAEYGQSCATAPCCNGVPCTNGLCIVDVH